MSRANFTKQTKRDALRRSGGKCEAAGALYGLNGQRCNADLSYGVEFDHLILEANSHDNSLENCIAACPACHRFKTSHHDTPLAAKTLRQKDKNAGIRNRSTRPFPGGRDSKLMRKMDGRVVNRITGEPA